MRQILFIICCCLAKILFLSNSYKDEIGIGLFGVDPGGHFTSSTVASTEKWTTLVVEIQ
jgi:hypothetical protein